MSNLENNIQKEFQNREIQPSANSWNALSSKLKTVSKKPKRAFVFYKIAAVVTGLLIMLSLFLNKEKTIIISDKNNVIKSNMPLISNPIDENSVTEIKLVKSTKKSTTLKTKNKGRKTKNNRVQNQRNYITKTVLAQNIIQKKEDVSIVLKEKIDQLAVINTSKSSIHLIEKSFNTFKKIKIAMHSSDEDIDKMLADAMSNDSPTNYSLLIKENQLKNIVENELLKSERHKLLKVIKTGVDTVENFVVANN